MQGGGGDDAGVSGDGIALGQHQHVPRDDVSCRDVGQSPVPKDNRVGSRHGGKGCNSIGGFVLLDEPQDRVCKDNHQDDDGVDRDALRALQNPGEGGDRDGNKQQVHQWVCELA